MKKDEDAIVEILAGATTAILGSNPEESTAAMMSKKKTGNNPRYVDRDLQMKYGEDKGKQAAVLRSLASE